MYFVYIIRNQSTQNRLSARPSTKENLLCSGSRDRKIYIGYTNNLRRRIFEHKQKKPDLIYYEGYKNKLDAQTREKKLKQRGQAIRWLKERIKNSLKE